MRVAVVTNLYPPHVLGGYEILCEQVCRRLQGRGWDVHVLTSRHGMSEGDSEHDASGGVPVDRRMELFLPFGAPPVIDRPHRNEITAKNRAVAKQWLSEVDPQIVFFWSLLRVTVGAVRAAMDLRKQVAFTFNDANIESYLPAKPNRPHRWIQDHILYPDATLKGIPLNQGTCISGVLREEMRGKLGPSFDAKVIHQGVPLEDLEPKADIGDRHEPFRVLYAGQLHAYKGVMDLVDAAATLGPQVEVRIAGAGDVEFERALKAKAAANTTLVGRVPRAELVEQYRWADALVFPSVWKEPFGLTHLEAMACGTPVISTANGGQGEFLEDGVNALVVNPESPAQIAAAVERLSADDDLRRRIATRGMEVARTKYSMDRYVDDLESWLKQQVAA